MGSRWTRVRIDRGDACIFYPSRGRLANPSASFFARVTGRVDGMDETTVARGRALGGDAPRDAIGDAREGRDEGTSR